MIRRHGSATPRRIALVILLPLAGCVTDSQTYLADGSQGYHVTCGGAIFSMGDCHKRAAQTCGPRGFQIVAGGTESTPYAVAGANVGVYGGSAYGSSGRIVNRDLIVKCGQS